MCALPLGVAAGTKCQLLAAFLSLSLLPMFTFLPEGVHNHIKITPSCFIWADNVEKLYWSSKTLHMTSEGVGKIFKGDFTDLCGKINCACVNGGTGRHVKCAQTGSKDPQ